jgi:hypothetical protein
VVRWSVRCGLSRPLSVWNVVCAFTIGGACVSVACAGVDACVSCVCVAPPLPDRVLLFCKGVSRAFDWAPERDAVDDWHSCGRGDATLLWSIRYQVQMRPT